ncbi:MAG: holo-ACP synthase [Candidatus Kapaibacterium sp.]
MIIGIGSDIVDVARIAASIENYGTRFLDRIFTPTEQEYCRRFHGTEAVHFAARFAYKEAFSKAIGTGITRGFQFKECGVRNMPSGQPAADLSGGMSDRYGHFVIHVTLSHTDTLAMAVVVIETSQSA